MHDEIIRYSIEGEIADSNLVTRKERLVSFVETQMREDGVVPSLDLEPQFTLDYNPESETYKFSLSAYGVHVGMGGDLWGTAGVMSGKKIMKSTPLTKLKAS